MAKRWNIVLVGVALVMAAALAGCAGGGDDPSAEDFQASVVDTRDQVDFALARIPQAQNEEDYLDRLDQAGSLINAAAKNFDKSDRPEEFADESKRLIRNLRELAASLHGTAAEARELGYKTLLSGATGLNFESWDRVNAVFGDLREQGIEVRPLDRH